MIPPRSQNLVLGFGLALAAFTKIQAIGAVILFLFILGWKFFKAKSGQELPFYLFGLLLGSTFIFSILVILDGPVSAFKHFLRYFEGSTAKVQFEGRGGIGGFPPFHQYFSEPIYLLAIIGCALVLIHSRGKERVFANAAIAQIGTLLLIYLVTQRGGSLIHNYTFDFLLLGIICFSIAMCKFFEELKYSYKVILAISVFSISIFSNFYSSTHIKFIGQLGIGSPSSSLSLFAFLGLIVFFFVSLNIRLDSNNSTKSTNLKKKKGKIIWIQVCSLFGFTLLFVSSLANVDRGYWDSTFKVYESQPYHALSKRIMTLLGNICVEVKLDRPDILDSGPRLRGVYETFYSKTGDGVVYINGLNSMGKPLQTSCDFYVTDFADSSFQGQLRGLVDGSSVVIADSKGSFVASVQIPLRNIGL